MTRHQASRGKKTDDVDITKYYIITRPTKLSDLADDLEDYSWRNQSRQLQARRWRKLRHQIV
jgi:hypothetical protein